jgi:hypothetical protein
VAPKDALALESAWCACSRIGPAGPVGLIGGPGDSPLWQYFQRAAERSDSQSRASWSLKERPEPRLSPERVCSSQIWGRHEGRHRGSEGADSTTIRAQGAGNRLGSASSSEPGRPPVVAVLAVRSKGSVVTRAPNGSVCAGFAS